LGRRSRKQRPPGPAQVRRGYERTELKNAEVRERLRPLEPGERPTALVVASVLAAALAVGNLGAYAAGVEVQGQEPGPLGVILFAALMAGAAWGMWHQRYWAVLGFEAILGITVAIAALSLLVASNLAAVALCLAIIGLGGWLFWKLVRVMARLQTPERRPRDAVR
jgi:hypothetical protein